MDHVDTHLATSAVAAALAAAHTNELLTSKIERLTADVSNDRVRQAERHGEMLLSIERQSAKTDREFFETRLFTLTEADRTRELIRAGQADRIRDACVEDRSNLAALFCAQKIPATPFG